MVSCHTRQNYQRANDVVDEKAFQNRCLAKRQSKHGKSLLEEIFTDAVLQKHIAKALENNLDIRIALQNIARVQKPI